MRRYVFEALIPASGLGSLHMDSQAKEQIRKMINLTGIENSVFEIVIQIIDSYRQSVPNAPEEFWQEFMKLADIDGLIDLFVPVYGEHLSAEELDQAIGFYESPAGKKIASNFPLIHKKSIEISQDWWRKIITEAVGKWERGYRGPEKRDSGRDRRSKRERRINQLLDKIL